MKKILLTMMISAAMISSMTPVSAYADTSNEEASYEDAAYEDASYEDAAYEEAADEETAYEETADEEVAYEDASYEEAADEEVAYEEVSYEETVYEEAADEDTSNEDISYEEIAEQEYTVAEDEYSQKLLDGEEQADAVPVPVSETKVSGIENKTYTGQPITQDIKVSFTEDDKEIVLEEGTDYTVSYSSNINAGSARMILTGAGRFSGTAEYSFAIGPVRLSSIELAYSSLVYKGTPRTQSKTAIVKAEVNGASVTLERDKDYTLKYENNTEVGKAYVTAAGRGNFTGEVSAVFNIIPDRIAISGLNAGTGKITVNFAGIDMADGYQAQACRKKDFSSDIASKTVNGSGKTAALIKNLVPGKTYYVRIRAFKKAGGVKYYSKWSKKKYIKLKYNTISVSGTGKYRTVALNNPKSSVTSARVGIWSNTRGQDDLKWYKMKKRADGSWTVKVYALYLKNSGLTHAHVYVNKKTFIGGEQFTFTRAEYKSTRNTVRITGSGDTRTLTLVRPQSGIKNLKVAVWTEKEGQDDIAWYTMKKQSNGTWKTTINMRKLLHPGNAYAHVYANGNSFIKEKTFTAPVIGFPVCSSEEEYINGIASAVQNACRKYGYLPSVLIAQSCLENGYGIPSYWDNPEISALMRYNNMVGMKTSLLNSSWYDKTVWPGESIVKQTPEEYDGVKVTITDSFRVYDNIEQSFEDFLLFLTYASNYGYGGTPKYGPSVLKIKDPEKLITTVAGRGYATDSAYAASVMRIIKKHDLTKYDNI